MGGHVDQMGREAYTGFWWENLRERDHWRHPGVDGRIILRSILRKWDGESMDWINLAQERNRWRARVCGNESSGYIKYGEFLD
jgi:hypothetical protein